MCNYQHYLRPFNLLQEMVASNLQVFPSFKIEWQRLSVGRYYIELDRSKMEGFRRRFEQISRALDLPENAKPEVAKEWRRGRWIGAVGAGTDGDRVVYKFYWGYRDRADTAIKSMEWQPRSSQVVQKVYDAVPSVRRPDTYLLMEEALSGAVACSPPLDRHGILRSCASILGRSHHLQRAVRVREHGSRRRSIDFDFNVVDAPALTELTRPLRALAEILRLPAAGSEWIERLETERLWHLAIGTNRRRSPFVTVYHGPTSRPPEPFQWKR